MWAICKCMATQICMAEASPVLLRSAEMLYTGYDELGMIITATLLGVKVTSIAIMNVIVTCLWSSCSS